MRKLAKDRHGQGTFEFVLILPMITFLVVLALTFGKMVYVKVAAETAAREAARTYAIYSAQVDREAAVSLARQAAANNLLGVLPVKKEYFDPVRDVAIEDVALAELGGEGFLPVSSPNGEYCRAEVTVRVPVEAPLFRHLLGKVESAPREWYEPYGEREGNEYVKTIRENAVFKKEAKVEQSGAEGGGEGEGGEGQP